MKINSPFFLNVDLDIESKSTLRPLARELGDKVVVMFSGRIKGRHCLFMESADMHKGPEETINALCDLIEGLSPAGMRVWEAAQKKTFDVGYEARLSSKRANHFNLPPSVIRRVANLGASLAVTFYQEDMDKVDGSDNGKKLLAHPKRKQK
jgi:hypothetical protein